MLNNLGVNVTGSSPVHGIKVVDVTRKHSGVMKCRQTYQTNHLHDNPVCRG